MWKKHYDDTEIYSFPVTPVVSREKMISVSKQMQRMNKQKKSKYNKPSDICIR